MARPVISACAQHRAERAGTGSERRLEAELQGEGVRSEVEQVLRRSRWCTAVKVKGRVELTPSHLLCGISRAGCRGFETSRCGRAGCDLAGCVLLLALAVVPATGDFRTVYHLSNRFRPANGSRIRSKSSCVLLRTPSRPRPLTRTGHDDVHTQARGSDPAPPVGRLPRGAERGEWRFLCDSLASV